VNVRGNRLQIQIVLKIFENILESPVVNVRGNRLQIQIVLKIFENILESIQGMDIYWARGTCLMKGTGDGKSRYTASKGTLYHKV
jgi:hypothetical protein